jgi:hypothetical protein
MFGNQSSPSQKPPIFWSDHICDGIESTTYCTMRTEGHFWCSNNDRKWNGSCLCLISDVSLVNTHVFRTSFFLILSSRVWMHFHLQWSDCAKRVNDNGFHLRSWHDVRFGCLSKTAWVELKCKPKPVIEAFGENASPEQFWCENQNQKKGVNFYSNMPRTKIRGASPSCVDVLATCPKVKVIIWGVFWTKLAFGH